MIDSFLITSSGDADMILGIDYDDYENNYSEYQKILSISSRINHYISKGRKGITCIYNDIFSESPSYFAYNLINDDFIFMTDSWDSRVLRAFNNEIDIVYCNDLMNGENLCVSPFITNRLAKAVGWLQYPGVYHLFGDVIWRDIGQALRNMKYLNNIYIEHQHFLKMKPLFDDTYAWTNSLDMYKIDQEAYSQWRNLYKDQVINRIREKVYCVR
jgi:hypothetical protein